MATVRYQVDGVPSIWAHAFFPTPGLSPAGATSIQRFTWGAPGTLRVPSPKPRWSGRQSTSRAYQSPSDVAPDWFLPQLYVNDITQLRPPVRYMPADVIKAMPPPIIGIGEAGTGPPTDYVPVVMKRHKIGGRRSMHWPRVILRWPNLDGRYGRTD